VQGYDDFPDKQVKHLEMIQAVVARLAGHGFLIKSWAITVAGAFIGFAVDRHQWGLALVALAPTLLFWLLDASFLRNERLFRDLFDRVRQGIEAPFYMGATAPDYVARVRREAQEGKRSEDIGSRLKTVGREALVLFYGAIILACVVTTAIVCHARH
jgi:hypothetical protein